MFQDAPASVPKNVLLPEGVDSTISQAFTRYSTDKRPQEWIITRKDYPKVAHSSGAPCFNRIEKGDLHLAVKGLYYPPNQAVAVSTTFRYCINTECTKRKRSRSNILPLQSNVVFLDPNANPTDAEMQFITDRGFQTKLKIRIGAPA